MGNGGRHYEDTGTADQNGEIHFNREEARGGRFRGNDSPYEARMREEFRRFKWRQAQETEQARRRAPSPPRTTRVCPHSVLGVACDASPQDLRSAYRARAKDTHPDLGLLEEREQRTRLMKRLNKVYEAALKGVQ